jgi:predicted kinase
MSMQRVVILQGLPGSGKTTWAKRFIALHKDWCRINRDDIRSMLYGSDWSGIRESLVTSMRDAMYVQALLQGWNVIIDDTNLRMYTIDRLCILGQVPALVDIKVLEFTTPVEVCIHRDATRSRPVGDERIRDMAEKWEHVSLSKQVCIPGGEVEDITIQEKE